MYSMVTLVNNDVLTDFQFDGFTCVDQNLMINKTMSKLSNKIF